jgi:hypothetical protein
MSSPFSSALANLDGSLQTIQSQFDCLQAGLEVNVDQLSHSFMDAHQHAAQLRDLIRAERPDADWTDRRDLEHLIHELEIAAKARRNQQRRTKLLELANELDAGRVKHRRSSRTTALNTLRLEAVKELRTKAALSEQEKDLPGPNASEWLPWASSLQEAKDALVLTDLRRDFGAAERFAGELEERYWIPGQRLHESPGRPSQPSVRPVEEPAAELHTPPSSKPVVPVGAGQGAPSPEAAALQPAEQPSANSSPEPAEEVAPNFGELVLSKRPVPAWVAAATIVVLFAIFAGIHHFHATTSIKPVQAAPKPSLTEAEPTTPLLHKQPVEGAQDKILLSTELCERVNPESIECWGYVSNLGDVASNVSLSRADVIDGKGNSFNLNGNDFSTGRSFNIPAGSRAKYTVKVPDRDREARTLTLYVDVANPRGLEYTFRDVPVAD